MSFVRFDSSFGRAFRKAIVAAVLVLPWCGVTAVSAQEVKGAEPRPAGPSVSTKKVIGPFEFENPTLELGKFRDTEKKPGEFHFKNATDQEVTVLNVKASCGCTAADLPKKVYAPGEAGVLNVTFDGKLRQGKDSKSITLETNYTKAPNATVIVTAEIIARIAIEPRAMFLGELARKAASPVKELKITSRNTSIKLEAPKIADPRFTCVLKDTTDATADGEPVKVFRYEIGFKGGEAIANEKSQIDIKTDDPEMKTISIFALANVVGALRIVPSHQMQVFEEKAGKAFEREIMISHREAKSWTLTDFKLADVDPALGLSIEKAAPDARRPGWIVLKLKGKVPESADKKPIQLKGQILLSFDCADEPSHVLQLLGTLKP